MNKIRKVIQLKSATDMSDWGSKVTKTVLKKRPMGIEPTS